MVSDSQVYSLRILLVSDAAFCICSGKDRTAATINYSVRTPMPPSLLGNVPMCHQHFFPHSAFLTYILVLTAVKKNLKSTFFTLLQVSISLLDGGQRPCCVVIVQTCKHRLRPKNRLIFMSNMKRSQLYQGSKD